METPDNGKRFSTIYVVEPSHDFSALKKYTDNIVFLSTGYEDLKDLSTIIRNNLQNFCIETDAIVPVGKIVWTFVAGLVIAERAEFEEKFVTIGIFSDRDYVFREV